MSNIEICSVDVDTSDFLHGIAAEEFERRLSDRMTKKINSVIDVEFQKNVKKEKSFLTRKTENYSHYICSSSLDVVCSAGWIKPSSICKYIEQKTNVRSIFSNAMQCASWGFAVRQHLKHKSSVENILLSIIDANPLGMSFWDDNPSWGKSNFRVTHIHLKKAIESTDGESSIAIGKCNPEAMLYDYAGAIYREAERCTGYCLATPYFSEKMRKGLNRVLVNYPHLRDQFDEYGHLYGADPWLSIVDNHRSGEIKNEKYLISSIASEGYYCFLKASVNERSTLINHLG